MWSGLVTESLVNLLSAEARGLTRVSNGAHSNSKNANHAPLHDADHPARTGTVSTVRRKPHQDRMHWTNQQALVGEGQENGSGTHHESPKSVQHAHRRPSKNLEHREVERGIWVRHGR